MVHSPFYVIVYLPLKERKRSFSAEGLSFRSISVQDVKKKKKKNQIPESGLGIISGERVKAE